jgi:hypothetical protein
MDNLEKHLTTFTANGFNFDGFKLEELHEEYAVTTRNSGTISGKPRIPVQ